MSTIRDTTVLITGGASGIGRLMGELCLQKGAKRLIIWDKDTETLTATINDFRNKGYEVVSTLIDITQTEIVIETARQILKSFGPVDILINNAGIVVGKFFEEQSHAEIDKTMQINTQAMMHITREFLPAMLSAQKGHIVNIASAAGLAANPQMSVYVASKWAVIGWSETLRLELESKSKDLHVTTVTPFYISTGMFEGVKSPIVPIVKPESAARQIISAIEKNKVFCRMPWIVYLMPFFKGILPQRWFDVLIGKWFGIYSSMEQFKGR
ncbi:MAG: SDR family oxidoreductase [Chitinophagaceae bacterium]